MAALKMNNDSFHSLLLTEGINDCHVIAALCSHYNIQEGRFSFFNCGCDDQVLKKANALISGAIKKDSIGIVLDADVNLSGRWESIKHKLSKYGYTFPSEPENNGTILECEGKPTLGIWIMPNNVDVGMLEDFCATLIDPEKLKVAKEAVDKVVGTPIASFKAVHLSKAVVHTYLAWQDEPGRPLGQSITTKALEPSKESASIFATWLKTLFPVPN